MNFTEAAMLIQGSACVYSRKVRGLLRARSARLSSAGAALGVPKTWT